jgi:hypothetical protein
VRTFAATILLMVPLSLVFGLVARRFLRPRLHGLTVEPGAFAFGLRVIEGNIPGLSSHWRHGVATVNGDELTWRRSPFSATLTLHIVSLDGTRMRTPQGLEWLTRSLESLAIPARTADGTQIEIAVLRREVQRFRDRLGALSE